MHSGIKNIFYSIEIAIIRLIAFLSYILGINKIRRKYYSLRYGPTLTVIAYHRVNDLVYDDSPDKVSTAQFESQIKYLKDNCRVITFSEAIRIKERNVKSSDAVIITFDDGYIDNYINVVPILNKYGLKACFFISTDLIDCNNYKSECIAKRWKFQGMNWTDIKDLHTQGFDLGAHTCSHPNLITLPYDKAIWEIFESKNKIENVIGRPIEYFAYPYGKMNLHYDNRIKEAVASKFKICCTTNRGRNSFISLETLDIKRICVKNWWSIFHFARELEGT